MSAPVVHSRRPAQVVAGRAARTTVLVQCETCRAQFTVMTGLAGETVTCKHCQNDMLLEPLPGGGYLQQDINGGRLPPSRFA